MTRYTFLLYGSEDWFDGTEEAIAADLRLFGEFDRAVERAGR
jgi:hypothetical protein